MKTIIVYRQKLLPASETFIKAQAGSVRTFAVRFAGLQPAVPSIDLPTEPILLSSSGQTVSRVAARLYNFTGFAPVFHKRLKNVNPALIHAHFAPDGASAIPLASDIGVPLVVTLHGYDVTTNDENFSRSFAGKQYLRRREALLSKASLFICVSEFIRKQALSKGFPERKLQVHYIGIDRSMFQPVAEPQFQRVLFVGRLVEKKGCAYLLRAMRRVSDGIPSAELTVIGAGPLQKLLEQEAARLQLNCTFMGSQSTSVVRRLLAESRVLCLPSIVASDGDTEGLGMVLLEAQAMGRPVVGFRTGGIPEAVCEGETGLLAAPADDKELAAHLLTFLSDHEIWQRASRRAIEWVGQKFDLETQSRQLERYYREIIAA